MSEKPFFDIIDHEIGKLYFLSYVEYSDLSGSNETRECVLMYIGKSVDSWCCEKPASCCRIIPFSPYKSSQKKFIDLKTNNVYYLFYNELNKIFSLCVLEHDCTKEVYSFYPPITGFDIEFVYPQEGK